MSATVAGSVVGNSVGAGGLVVGSAGAEVATIVGDTVDVDGASDPGNDDGLDGGIDDTLPERGDVPVAVPPELPPRTTATATTMPSSTTSVAPTTARRRRYWARDGRDEMSPCGRAPGCGGPNDVIGPPQYAAFHFDGPAPAGCRPPRRRDHVGMLRLRQIALVSRDLEPVVSALHDSLHLEVAHRDPAVAVFGLHNAVMPIGDQFLEVVSPTRVDTAAGRYLDRRNGDGGYMVILQCEEHAARKDRLTGLGVRFALADDNSRYHLLQLHPADTGGSFLEIDEQVGGESIDGPWEPAGPGWQAARRTDVVTAIVGARLQSPDPERLAARWAELLERSMSVHRSADGADFRIGLDNAVLSFVEPDDDRGEGLAGLTLAGAPGNDEVQHLTICGIHITVEPPAG